MAYVDEHIRRFEEYDTNGNPCGFIIWYKDILGYEEAVQLFGPPKYNTLNMYEQETVNLSIKIDGKLMMNLDVGLLSSSIQNIRKHYYSK